MRRFRLVASYGPQQLFLLLKRVAETKQRRAAGASFDFDWMKRAVVLAAPTAEMADAMVDEVMEELSRKAAPGQLLPGPTREENGRHVVRAGVLLQTPDIYAEQILASLSELGCTAAAVEEDGVTIAIPPSRSFGMDYASVVSEFPLPPYLSIEEVGEAD